MTSHCDPCLSNPGLTAGRGRQPQKRGASHAAAGFTLLELMIVLVIAALMTTLFAINGRPVSPATHARGAARAISGALRSARSEAIMTNRSVSFTLDAANRRYRWGQRPEQALPGDLQVSLLTSRDQVASGAAGNIRFDPDGGSSGGRVTITGGDRTIMVGVDWLSGRVSIEQKPH
jgi:general secretion pathway protein H